MNFRQPDPRHCLRKAGARSGVSHPRDSLIALALTAALGTLASTAPATALARQVAADAGQQQISIPPGGLRDAIDALASASGITVLYSPELVSGKTTRGLSGRYPPADALRRLLQGSGLEARAAGEATFTLQRAASSPNAPRSAPGTPPATTAAPEPEPIELARMVITGSRIRGGETPSPVITIDAGRIREEGFTNLGQVIRSVPQNFQGGQNPGVIGVSSGVSNQDLTGSSALNLRGLGPDASLTLLNGRRLAYDGFAQAVDISAIPVEAVERLEIVPDGASAIYGSDAVGGVANVVLARDFDGVALGARFGEAAEGGLQTREYTATAGTNWGSGGMIVTFKDVSTDPIQAHDRSYTSHLTRPYTIYNGWNSRNALLSLHQSVGEGVELKLDTLGSERDSRQDVSQPGVHQQYFADASSLLVSPSAVFFLGNDWSLSFGGAYGRNENDVERYLMAVGGSSLIRSSGYRNTSRSAEIGAEGPVFQIGQERARLAVGLGSRKDELLELNHLTGIQGGGDESSRYAYAELNLPVVSPGSATERLHRLELSAAIRTEDYDSFGSVSTPKLGMVYGPNADLTFKTSWGRSFKAPTLNHRYQNKQAYLWAAAATGGSGYPPEATALMSYGGNQDLHAERARTWTASLALHPQALPGLEAELTLFDVDYTDRVVEPVNYQFALSDPIYAEYVDYAPTPEQQAALLAAYSDAFYNLSGRPYDPANVVAIIRDQYINAARQRIRGVDLSGSYGFDLGSGRLTARGSASWLSSTQQTTPAQPERDLAGFAFNPARFNGRLGAVWSTGGFDLATFVNHSGGITIRSQATTEKTGSFTTFDTTLRYDIGERGDMLSNLGLSLSVQNLFNREPPLYTPPNANFVPYDATNYSAIGRFMSVSVSKRW